MSKILIFGDLHIHRHKKSFDRLQDCLTVLDWIFGTADEANVEHVVSVGDLFFDRQKIDVLTYQKTFELFQKYTSFQTHLLIGNHDMWQLEKWDISSLKPLAAIDNVSVISHPCTLMFDGHPVSFLPYVSDPILGIQQLENPGPYKLLFSHIAVDGALWNSVYSSYSDVVVEHDGEMIKVAPDIFTGWDRVFLGHYHAAQKLNDVAEYIGSPLQLNYGEAFQEKHIAIFDLETKRTEYVKNDFSPQHLVYSLEEAEKIQNPLASNNFLKIRTNNIVSPKNLEVQRRLVPHFSEVKVEAIPRRANQVVEEKNIVENAKAILYQDETKMSEMYVDAMGTKGLNRQKLMSVFFEQITNKRKQDA